MCSRASSGGPGSFVSKWPREWQSVAQLLQSSESCDAAVHCHQAEKHDVYQRAGYPTCLPPDWRDLANYLCLPVPTLENQELNFSPRLHQLPVAFLTRFAEFLVRCHSQIPALPLQEFCACLQALPASEKCVGDSLVIEREVSNAEEPMPPSPASKLREVSTQLVALSKRRPLPNPSKDEEVSHCVLAAPSKRRRVASDCSTATESIAPVTGQHSGEVPANAGRAGAPGGCVLPAASHEESTPEESIPTSQQRAQHSDLMDATFQSSQTSILARSRRQHPSHLDLDGQEHLQPLSASTKLALSRLLDDFTSGNERAAFSDLGVLSVLTLNQVEAFFSMMDSHELSESALATVVKQLSSIQDELSVTVSDFLCHKLLAPKIISLGQLASRSLYTTVSQLVGQFCRPILAAVLVPILVSVEQAGPAQCELVRRLIREVLSPEQCQELASLFLSHAAAQPNTVQWSDEQLSCIQAMMEAKVLLDGKACSDLVRCVQRQAVDQAKNLKFAKLFLAVLQKQTAQLSPHIAVLQSAADANNTFLKKPLLSAIKKLS